MKVWVDQNLCTGDGICEQLCPSVFRIAEDGLAYVVNDIRVDEWNIDQIDQAIDECPGECIFLEDETNG